MPPLTPAANPSTPRHPLSVPGQTTTASTSSGTCTTSTMTEELGASEVCEEMLRALRLLFEPGQVVELRAPDVSEPHYRQPHTVAGYFNDIEALADAAMAVGPHAKGVYITLNPVNPDLLARAANRTKVFGPRDAATSDKDIEARRWLAIDTDPKRPANISSTDAEHAAALQRAAAIADFLGERGWDAPIRADSGNGGHLLYRIDLPADDGGLVQRVLQALAATFSDTAVEVDVTVYNAARIWKLYGSVARKGDSILDRPHRCARLLSVPAQLQPAGGALLEALVEDLTPPASPAPPAVTHQPQPAQRQSQQHHQPHQQRRRDADAGPAAFFDLDAWIAAHDLDVREPRPFQDKSGGMGRKWAFHACPFDDAHTTGAALFQFESGAIAFRCLHNGCTGKDWHALRDLYGDPPYREDDDGGVGAGRGEDTSSMSTGRSKAEAAGATCVQLLLHSGEVFRDPSGQPYIDLDLGTGERRTVQVWDAQVTHWLHARYFDRYGVPVGKQAVESAVATVQGMAMMGQVEHPVYTRLAPDGLTPDGLYLDLGTGNQVVHATADGWQVVDCPSTIKFQRPSGFQPLPEPERGDTLAGLRPFLNVGVEGDQEADDRFRLMAGWLVGSFMPDGDYPLLVLNGQKGSAKTTTMRMLRSLVDPHEAIENKEPESSEELLLQAAQTWVSSFDNLRSVKPWLSDALCRLATGSTSGKRKLYTDSTRLITKVRRPAILNGIPDLAKSDDLLERSLRVRLPAIPPDKRSLRTTLGGEFAAARPRLLGALLDAVVVALRDRNAVNDTLTRRPRMADWYVWVLAAARSGLLGFTPQEFAETVHRNLTEGQRSALEANAVTDMLLLFMAEQHTGRWDGTLEGLFNDLTEFARKYTDIRSPHGDWPHTPAGFRWRLNAAEADLAAVGLTIERRHDGTRRRLAVTYCPHEPEPQVAANDLLTFLTVPNGPPLRNVTPSEPQFKPAHDVPNVPNVPPALSLDGKKEGKEGEEKREEEKREEGAGPLGALRVAANPHGNGVQGPNVPPSGSVRGPLGPSGNVSPQPAALPSPTDTDQHAARVVLVVTMDDDGEQEEETCLVPGCDQPIYAELPDKGLCAEHSAETEPGYDWPWSVCDHPTVERRDEKWVCVRCSTDWERRKDIPAHAVVRRKRARQAAA